MKKPTQLCAMFVISAASLSAWGGGRVLADGPSCTESTPTDQWVRGQCWFADAQGSAPAYSGGSQYSLSVDDRGQGIVSVDRVAYNGSYYVYTPAGTISVAKPDVGSWNVGTNFYSGEGSYLDEDGNEIDDVYRFVWYSVADQSNDNATFELLIGPGFDLSFRYGSPTIENAYAGYTIDGTTADIAGPLGNAEYVTDGNGHLVAVGGSSAIPEPDIALLALAGGAAQRLTRRRSSLNKKDHESRQARL